MITTYDQAMAVQTRRVAAGRSGIAKAVLRFFQRTVKDQNGTRTNYRYEVRRLPSYIKPEPIAHESELVPVDAVTAENKKKSRKRKVTAKTA